MKKILIYVVLWFSLGILGFFVGKNVANDNDTLLEIAVKHTEIRFINGEAVLVYSCNGEPLYYWNVEKDSFVGDTKVSNLFANLSPQARTINFSLSSKTIGAVLAGGIGGLTIKDLVILVSNSVSSRNLSKIKIRNRAQLVAAVVVCAVSGYGIGYGIGYQVKESCQSEKIHQLLRDKNVWAKLEAKEYYYRWKIAKQNLKFHADRDYSISMERFEKEHKALGLIASNHLDNINSADFLDISRFEAKLRNDIYYYYLIKEKELAVAAENPSFWEKSWVQTIIAIVLVIVALILIGFIYEKITSFFSKRKGSQNASNPGESENEEFEQEEQLADQAVGSKSEGIEKEESKQLDEKIINATDLTENERIEENSQNSDAFKRSKQQNDKKEDKGK